MIAAASPCSVSRDSVADVADLIVVDQHHARNLAVGEAVLHTQMLDEASSESMRTHPRRGYEDSAFIHLPAPQAPTAAPLRGTPPQELDGLVGFHRPLPARQKCCASRAALAAGFRPRTDGVRPSDRVRETQRGGAAPRCRPARPELFGPWSAGCRAPFRRADGFGDHARTQWPPPPSMRRQRSRSSRRRAGVKAPSGTRSALLHRRCRAPRPRRRLSR